MPDNLYKGLYPTVVAVRATPRWQTWLKELADQQQRTPARYLRDLISYLHETGGIDLADTDFESQVRLAGVKQDA
ncbi:MAG TPA: hypothetical protein PLK20_03480 [Paludibacteraceae bacterium]|jgi:hypothetical protein|nr:hypothetical protein [Paludibacteraceae bacterium]HQP80548.1 hypothetical protein [Paludibacteraceae bacterium]